MKLRLGYQEKKLGSVPSITYFNASREKQTNLLLKILMTFWTSFNPCFFLIELIDMFIEKSHLSVVNNGESIPVILNSVDTVAACCREQRSVCAGAVRAASVYLLNSATADWTFIVQFICWLNIWVTMVDYSWECFREYCLLCSVFFI